MNFGHWCLMLVAACTLGGWLFALLSQAEHACQREDYRR